MLRKVAILSLAIFSTCAMAKPADKAPDCSADSDGRINDALVVSFTNKGLNNYINALLGNGPKDKAIDKIELLSSEEISKAEQKRLMLRNAQNSNLSSSEIKSSGLESMYMDQPLYRQYYKITSDKGFKAIAEFYAANGACAVDLENIYIVSDQVMGFTPDFADK